MTAAEALRVAQLAFPLDLVARVVFMRECQESSVGAERVAWTVALDLTRNGRLAS